MAASDSKFPDFRGVGLRDAMLWLERHNVVVSSEGYGRIVSQSITVGTTIIPGTKIHLKLEPF